MNKEILKDEIIDIISSLQEDEYNKFLNYVKNYDIIKKRKIEKMRKKQEKISKITNSINSFIEDYSSKNPYFYIPECNIFLKYDNTNYSIIHKNLIWYNLLSQLNKYPLLLKHKDNINKIFYQNIKKNILTSATPDSTTIQNIISFFQKFFCPNKDTAKYLLTIIGDCILKKEPSKVYITLHKITPFLIFFEDTLQEVLYGKQNLKKNFISKYFKSKYHNHDYENIRFIQTHEIKKCNILWDICKTYIEQNIYNIIVVACHYSYRYTSNEKFIQQYCNNNEIKEYSLYMNKRSRNDIVNDFIKTYIQINSNMNISDKEIYYLFQCYLKELKIPKIMFHSEFREEISKIITYENGLWKGVTSKYLEHIHYFLNSFFNIHFDIIVSVDYSSTYEISEICEIYNLWKKSNANTISFVYKEEDILNIISHFYPDIKIEDNRILYGIYTKLWDKKEDLQKFTSEIREHGYEEYYKWAKSNNMFVISKEYYTYYFTSLNS